MKDNHKVDSLLRVFHVGSFFDGRDRFIRDASVYVRDGIVEAIGEGAGDREGARLRESGFASAERIELANSFMMPGLINSHHHCYSALARGIPLTTAPGNFRDILAELWWRVDRALDLEAVSVSALCTAIEGIRHGCTTVIDHHSSPSCVRGSLGVISAAFRKTNLASILCFETSDRNGERIFEDSIAENLEFADRTRNEPLTRGMFGLHASFTLSDESLKKIAARKPKNLPVHVHVAEDVCDGEHARSLGYEGALARLNSFGLLDESSIVAHGIHLAESEYKLASDLGVRVAHNPESNCNNRVGYADLARFREDRLLLGTDGMNSDMLGAMHSAFLLQSGFGNRQADTQGLLQKMLFDNPAEYVSRVIGQPIGRIEVGAPADFAIFPYESPTPVTEENFFSHMIYALSGSSEAEWVYAHGKPVLEDGLFTDLNEQEVYEKARGVAARVWSEFAKL